MLPDGWKKGFSKTHQRDYFYNEKLNKTVWKLEEIDNLGKRPNEEIRSDEPAKKCKTNSDKGLRVCIIVPFRDLHVEQKRKEHLEKFIPHMENFLKTNQGIEYFHLLIVEQSDDGKKFNRGKLLNIGFKYACDMEKDFDSFVFHDVDLLPQKPLAEWYAKYPRNPIHIARCWGRYNKSKNYFGGVVAFSRDTFEKIDGFPNTFWGWGGEDDELQKRLVHEGIRIDSPSERLPNAIVDLENMDLKTKLDMLKQTNWKCNVKWEVRDEYIKYRDQNSTIPWWGLKGIQFSVVSKQDISEFTTKINVDVMKNMNSDGSGHWANETEEMH